MIYVLLSTFFDQIFLNIVCLYSVLIYITELNVLLIQEVLEYNIYNQI